ncbi:TonB-dependent receptor [Cesiribacter sp. SM1]|uniref:SusC/RagA family TonB-linked outer membrane protein n=1 Tax=Cesiribacter sp. SM1 TaxID=2861196 RepID=UPI001CD4C647|nr:TonB-dependent receptor [Cesiribacter sp. SM1]
MKRILLLSFVFLGLITSAWAQRTISGKVTAEGEGLPGVAVRIEGTTQGTVTDVDGNYRLEVPGNNAVLSFSFIGYAEKKVTVGNQSVINVTLAEDVEQLSEVVVVAYGEQSQRSLTSAVGQIDETLIRQQQVVDIGRTLQGTVPGVNIVTGSGQPGSTPQIRIRGISSINSSSEPLIVLDGAVYTGNLNTIDQNEIESISVLKDAAAAALYGSRAASGVILITSKKGKAGDTRINFTASSGFSERAVDEYPFVNTEQNLRLEWEALYNDARLTGDATPGQTASDELLGRIGYNPYGGLESPIGPNGELLPGQTLKWETDWEDALLQRGTRHDANLNVSGGSDKVTYFFSGSYLKQDGVVIGSDFERFAGRLNLDAELTDWLSAGLRQSISSSTSNFPQQSGTSFNNSVQYIRTLSSIYPIYRRDVDGNLILDPAGNPIFDDGQNEGPINAVRPVLQPSNAVAQTTLDRSVDNRFFNTTQAFLEASFLDMFKARTSFTLNRYTYDNPTYTNPTVGSARTVGGRIGRNRDFRTEWTLTNSLNWANTFNEDHKVDILLLQEAYDLTINTLNVSKTGLPFPGLYELNSAATLEAIGGAENKERIGSLMARAQYDFRNKYFVQGSVRRDISSRFAPESREGIFYSVSGSWVISDESFMDGIDFISFMKLRGSYGEVGNSFIQDNQLNQVYFPAENVFETGWDQLSTPGIYVGPLRNTQLTWETSAITNVGLDFGFFREKLTGSVDAYTKDTEGLIFARPLSNSLGVRTNSILENVGSLRNKGIEVALNYNILRDGALTWSVGANMAFERNEITELPQEEIITGNFKRVEGGTVYDFFIREWAGVAPSTGEPMWYRNVLDEAGNVVGRDTTTSQSVAQSDRIFAGTALPWGRGGFNTRLGFKGLDLSALFNFSLGGKLLDTDYLGLMEGGLRPGQQKHTDILRRWQQEGDITDVPRLNSTDQGASISTRFLRDASYGRLRNITLGYTLPENLISRSGFIRGLRVFVQGDNLFTFFPYEGLDPEQSIGGLLPGQTNNRSSIYKTVTAGIEINL